jgi:hypothetical protein
MCPGSDSGRDSSKDLDINSGKNLVKLPVGNSGKELPDRGETRVRRSGKTKRVGQGDFFALGKKSLIHRNIRFVRGRFYKESESNKRAKLR